MRLSKLDAKLSTPGSFEKFLLFVVGLMTVALGPTLSKIGGMETSFSSWMGKTTLLSLFGGIFRGSGELYLNSPSSDDLYYNLHLNSKRQVKSD